MTRYILGDAWKTGHYHCVDVRDEKGNLAAVIFSNSAHDAEYRAELVIAAFHVAEKQSHDSV